MSGSLAIPRPETLKDLVYKKVKDLLTSGQFQVDSVHSANQLADDLGVSRTPVREALLQLSAEGFLEPLEGRGFRVRSYDRKEIADLFEMRRLIETYLVERIAGGGTRALKPLADALRRMEEAQTAADLNAFLKADERFHLALIQLHGNRRIQSVMDHIHDCIAVVGKRLKHGRMAEVLAEHRRVMDALCAGDAPGAVAAMRRHLDTTEIYLSQTGEQVV